MSKSIAVEIMATRIFEIRGKKVMLDRDLAELYDVETKHLTRQVRRNIKRFPPDFMIQLTREDYRELLRRQFGALEMGKYSKYLPCAFTEQGIAMLSSVLNSDRAVQVNIQIMRAFVQIRKMLLTNSDLRRKIEEMEKKYDKKFVIVFEAIRQLLQPPKQTRAIGFHI